MPESDLRPIGRFLEAKVMVARPWVSAVCEQCAPHERGLSATNDTENVYSSLDEIKARGSEQIGESVRAAFFHDSGLDDIHFELDLLR